jgi:uncharacterized protein YcbK (DUF882 family)
MGVSFKFRCWLSLIIFQVTGDDNMKISKNFKRKEFECRCGCGFDTVDVDLVRVLQEVRDHFNNRVLVVSGARCAKHNERVEGASMSQHVCAKASDVSVEGYCPQDVYEHLDKLYPDRYGLGLYSTFVHVDVRANRARWRGVAI